VSDYEQITGPKNEAASYLRYRVHDLRAEGSWQNVYNELAGKASIRDGEWSHRAARSIIEQLRDLDVMSAIVEYPYFDADFAEEYAYFHAKTFRPPAKHCTRYHFFNIDPEDLAGILAPDIPERQRVGWLTPYSESSGWYRGFCVRRPIEDAPIGRTVIKAPPHLEGIWRYLSARHYTHILGIRFFVDGFPFLEQDARTGSCAQAALWMSLRHITAASGSPWRSIPALTQVATQFTDETNTLSVPIGSGGLHTNSMLRAVREANRYPHYFAASRTLSDGAYSWSWRDDQDPFAIACRYIDSDIPVVVLVAEPTTKIDRGTFDMHEGHALTAVGYYGTSSKRPPPGPRPHVSHWLDGLIVNNDQVGPNVDLPRSKSTSVRVGSGYATDNVTGLIISLPDQVILGADMAEQFAWHILEFHLPKWREKAYSEQDAENIEVASPLDRNSLAARTLLIEGFNHYRWLVQAGAHNKVLNLSARVHFPRYVWVTEFYPFAPDDKPTLQRVYAHVVTDATAANSINWMTIEPFMFAHELGIAWATVIQGDGTTRFSGAAINEDPPYASWRPMNIAEARMRARSQL
jgi:hypothetical protein